MRLLRSQSVDLYYPAAFQREAQDFAERAEGCIAELRKHPLGRGGLSGQRIEIILADLPFNNAFVKPPADGDFFSVVPTHFTMDLLTELGVPPAPSYIACHELTHYVQAQQTFRVLGGLNRALGYFLTPQVGLDAWFHEGLATYYETRLQPKTGRMAWPLWKGLFEAAVAGRTFRGGHLSPYNREVHWGNHYLYGSHFIAYLVEKYGEERLWRLVLRQGQSFFFPLLINQRFKKEYGKSLSTLLGEYDTYLAVTYPVRQRQRTQKVLRRVGADARYARASDGSEALIHEALDAPPTLSIYGVNGTLEWQQRLTDVLPKQKLVTPSSNGTSGLSFSRDGRFLYFVMVDEGPVYQHARLMRFDRREQHLVRLVDDIGGIGGDVSPDGRSYLFVAVSGHGHRLALLDLQTFERRVLHKPEPSVYLTAPRFSPDGRRIVVSVFDGAFSLALFDTETTARIETFSRDEQLLFDATWIDNEHLLLLSEAAGRFQVFTLDLTSRTLSRVSDAPYIAFQPRAAGGTVRFLNREGVTYTLDELPLALPEPPLLTQPTRTTVLADVETVPGATSLEVLKDAPTESAPVEAPPPTPPRTVESTEQASEVSEQIPPSEGSDDAAATPPPESNAPASPLPAPKEPTYPSEGAVTVRTGAPQALPAPPRLTLQSAQDVEAPIFPRLLIPSLRVPLPMVVAIDDESTTPLAVGFYLGGTDALGKHRWGVAAGVQPSSGRLSGSVGYLNAQLAPVLFELGASQLDYEERVSLTKAEQEQLGITRQKRDERRRQRDGFFTSLLVLRTTLLALGAHFTEDFQPDDLYLPKRLRSLGGGSFWFTHDALEATAMSGARRGFRIGLMGSMYPESINTLGHDVYDARGELLLAAPLPLSLRHTLKLSMRARALMGDRDLRLLEVGGLVSGSLFNRPEQASDRFYPGLPPKRRFSESLRGFETALFDVNQIGIAELTYRYPLIIDVGTATSLWILPSFFLRQIDFEVFATAATDSARTPKQRGHAASGGALSVRFVWLVPLVLRYELAQRMTDDRALQHLIVFDIDAGG